MEISYESIVSDDDNLVKNVLNSKCDMIPITISLPEYLDITSLLALQKRMFELAKLSGKKLRLLGSTTNLAVEKAAVRLFSDRDDVYLTIDWRDIHD